MATATDPFSVEGASLGENWTELVSGFTVAGGVALAKNNSTYQFAYYDAVAFSGDHYSQVKVNAGTQGVIVRAQAGGDLYMVQARFGNNDVYLYKRISGGFTQIGDAITSVSWADGDTLKAEITGTTIKLYRNGSQIGSDYSDSALSGGAPGIMLVSTGEPLDDWEGGDLGGSTPTPVHLLRTQQLGAFAL